MKACHVVYGYFPFDPRVRREVDALVRRGHEVHVISAMSHDEVREESLNGVRVHRVPWPVIRGGKTRYLVQYVVFFILATARLLRLHVAQRFDVIHVHSLPDFQVLGALPERALGARVVLDLHEALPEIVAARFGQGMLVAVARALERVSCLVAHQILVVNEAIAALLVSRGVEPRKVTVVMNSPDLRNPKPRSRSELTAPFNGGRMIVYVGGINKERDLELLIHAAARLRDSHHARLAIYGYGDPSYKERLRQLADEERLGNDFFLGPALQQEDVIAYMALSEIGPITYQKNPLTELAIPNKVFEYAAAKKPLVVADLKSLRALFGEAALYYRPGKPEDLAGQIAKVLEDGNLSRELVEKALKVLDSCRWEIMERRLVAAYEGGAV
jgi:glycosyltransferase involved in cell wall biosynthesis